MNISTLNAHSPVSIEEQRSRPWSTGRGGNQGAGFAGTGEDAAVLQTAPDEYNEQPMEPEHPIVVSA